MDIFYDDSENDDSENVVIDYSDKSLIDTYYVILNLVHITYDDKYNLFINQLHDKNIDYLYDRNATFNAVFRLICNTISNKTSELQKYINLLSTYNNYNKLNILKTKTKLNNDIIFNIIIEYL